MTIANRYFFLMLFGLLFFSSSGRCYNIQSREIERQIIKEKKHLKEISKNIQKKTKTVDKLKKKEEVTLANLGAVREEIIKDEDTIWRLKKEIEEKNREIEKDKKKISLSNKKLRVYKSDLSCFMVNIYKYKNRGYLEYLVTAKDGCDLLKRYRFLTVLVTSFAHLVKDIEYQKNIILIEKKNLEIKCSNLKTLKDQTDLVYQKKIERERKEKRLLAETQENKDLCLRDIEYLKKASLNIKKLIEKLEVQKKKRKDENFTLTHSRFQTDQGRLRWPVDSREILRNFGKSKHKNFNAYVYNQGIDISVENKSSVRSAEAGKVVFSDWFKGYGQMVMLDHGGGCYTLYSNLNQILVADNSNVNKNVPIGIIENSSYLHFEVRINGNPINPLIWLER